MQHSSLPFLLLLCLGALAWGGCAPAVQEEQRPVPGARTEAEIPIEVREELLRMGRLDQEVRQGMTPASLQDTTFMRRMLQADSLNTARLIEIVERYGWPGASRVGEEAANAAFLVLQHSPSHELRRRMLPVLEEEARRGEVAPQEVALLVDRVLMHEGLPQRYGTQLSFEEGRMVLHPIEDEERVDERRAAMGLPPIEQYLKLIEEMYQAPVVRRP